MSELAGTERRPFYVRSVARQLGTGWHVATVTVFDHDMEIGAYERNHAGWAEETFEPFELNGKWYALYSRDYTATRVMSLPDCTDIGGEEPCSSGFCPVEFFVPRYKRVPHSSDRWIFETAVSYFGQDFAAVYGIGFEAGTWEYLAPRRTEWVRSRLLSGRSAA